MTQAWRADRAPLLLQIVVVLVGVAFAAPIVYVVWQALALNADVAGVLGESMAPFWRTLQLAGIVTLATGVVGTGMAWFLVRTDVPMARVLRIVAPLPLVFPSFIGAAAFIAGLAPDGAIRSFVELVGYHPPRRFRGLAASSVVLTAFTYPYVYLPVAARLITQPPSIEESARLLGDTTPRLFTRVVLPDVRRSLLGGMLIVFLYCLSEFGAVQLLGYDTLTRVVYATRLLDRAASFTAAALLIFLALVAVAFERRLSGSPGRGFVPAARRKRPIPIGRWRLPALLAVTAVLAISLVAPIVALAEWAWRGIDGPGSRLAALGDELSTLREPAAASAWLGVLSAFAAILVVLPAAVLAGRFRSRVTPSANAAMLAGFAVPGLVIALSFAFWALNISVFARLYQTAPLLIAAYVVHFGAQALRSSEVAVGGVPRNVDESARLLGASSLRRALTIHAPLMRPGLVAGAGLVLLSTVKELPATLLLAPIGLETLATRAWGAFEGGFLAEAGLASLVLVVTSGVLTWFLVLRRADRIG